MSNIYIGTTIAVAEPMTYREYLGVTVEDDTPVIPAAGYRVEIPNQPTTWLSESAFNSVYRSVDKIGLQDALTALKKGYKVTRPWLSTDTAAWLFIITNNNGRTFEYVNGRTEEYKETDWIGMMSYSKITPWVPNQDDLLANDWVILE